LSGSSLSDQLSTPEDLREKLANRLKATVAVPVKFKSGGQQ
jgi:hypothetical protein